MVAAAAATAGAASFDERKRALKECLAREYRSFFRPFEADFYSDGVSFQDPLNELKGKDSYRKNVEMLSGESPVGNILFSDGYIDLHAVEEVPGDDRRLRTRWTLGFTFRLLPWKPKALFTGVSEYVVDENAQVLSQRDYWDTINMGNGGVYAPEAAFSGLADLGAQLLPSFLRGAAAEEPEAAGPAGDWALLRRAAEYRVYRSKRSGRVFAISAPGVPGDTQSLANALRGHGLKVGSEMRVRLDGRPEVDAESAGGSGGDGVGGSVPSLELLPPHPWEA